MPATVLACLLAINGSCPTTYLSKYPRMKVSKVFLLLGDFTAVEFCNIFASLVTESHKFISYEEQGNESNVVM